MKIFLIVVLTSVVVIGLMLWLNYSSYNGKVKREEKKKVPGYFLSNQRKDNP